MKILIVNSSDRGGAANACLRLYAGLLKLNQKPGLLLQSHTRNFPTAEPVQTLRPEFSKFEKAKKAFKKVVKDLNLYPKISFEKGQFHSKRSSQLEFFSYPYSNYDITKAPGYEEADIINLHWVARFLDYESFFRKNNKPVVWTLHDMNPFTGGEHYTEFYEGIDEDGLLIKRRIAEFEKNEFKKVLKIKIDALKNVANLTIVAPSQWLANEAKNSEVFKGRPVHCIPYGLDSQVFAPRNKTFSRRLLNIPEDKTVILFVADTTTTPRKGFIFLKKAIEKLELENLVLCSVGNKNSELNTTNELIELGSINDEKLMSVAYSAADVFVIPSIMDNLPNTVLESLMCGTPVIGFPVGGIKDMIENGVNGILTKEICVNSLIEALKTFLANPGKFDSEKIRQDAVKRYDEKIQAKKYLELFHQILED